MEIDINQFKFRKWRWSTNRTRLCGRRSLGIPGGPALLVSGSKSSAKIEHSISMQFNSWAKTLSDSCQLSCKKLAKFSPNAEQFKLHGLNDRRLRESIQVAEKIICGLSDLQTELKRFKLKSKTVTKNLGKKKSKQPDHQRTPEPLFEAMPSETTSLNDQATLMIPEFPLADQKPLIELSSTQSEPNQELDTLDINESNVTHLLEGGLLDKVKRLPEQKASRFRRHLKKILLQKYFSKKTQSHHRRVIVDRKPRTKPIQKPSVKPQVNRAPEEIEILCVRKLYSILKLYGIERQRARTLSIQAVRKLQDEAIAGSKLFVSAFASLVLWIKLNCSNLELAEQLSHQFSIDNKLPEDEQTCDSKTKNFFETSSSVF